MDESSYQDFDSVQYDDAIDVKEDEESYAIAVDRGRAIDNERHNEQPKLAAARAVTGYVYHAGVGSGVPFGVECQNSPGYKWVSQGQSTQQKCGGWQNWLYVQPGTELRMRPMNHPGGGYTRAYSVGRSPHPTGDWYAWTARV